MAIAPPLPSAAASGTPASHTAAFAANAAGRVEILSASTFAAVCASGSEVPVGKAGPSGEAPRCNPAPRSRSHEGVHEAERVEPAEFARLRGASGLVTTEAGEAAVPMLIDLVL